MRQNPIILHHSVMALPLAYLLTFTCYGSHLHGAELGSVDRDHNQVGSRGVGPDPGRAAASRKLMAGACYRLSAQSRWVVLGAIQQVCVHRHWRLIAAHVRARHVHVIVDAPVAPESVLHDFKAYATRALNESETPRRRWTRHGSTRYLWTGADVGAAFDYVLHRQGEPMAVYCGGSDPRSMTVAAR